MPTISKTRTVTLNDWSDMVSRHAIVRVEPPKQRREHRRHAEGPAKLVVRVASPLVDQPIVVISSLMEVSPHGLTVLSQTAIPRHVPINAELHLQGEVLALSGNIKHCTELDDGFKLGIELDFGK